MSDMSIALRAAAASISSTPGKFAEVIQADAAKFAKIIKATGAKVE